MKYLFVLPLLICYSAFGQVQKAAKHAHNFELYYGTPASPSTQPYDGPFCRCGEKKPPAPPDTAWHESKCKCPQGWHLQYLKVIDTMKKWNPMRPIRYFDVRINDTARKNN